MKRLLVVLLLTAAAGTLTSCSTADPALLLPTLYNGTAIGTLRSAPAPAACPGLRSTLDASAAVQSEVQATGGIVGQVVGAIAVSYCRPATVAAGTRAVGTMSFTCCASAGGTTEAGSFSGPVTVTFGGTDSLDLDLAIQRGAGSYLGATGTCHLDVRMATGPAQPLPTTPMSVQATMACRVGDQAHPPPPPSFRMLTAALPEANRNQPYRADLVAQGGTPPYRWRVATLPAGLRLVGSAITGTPTAPGEAVVEVVVDDGVGLSRTGSFPLFVRDPEMVGSIRSVTGGHPQRWGSMNASVSDDGGTVSFSSDAADLADPPGDGFTHDVFTLERSTGTVRRITSGDRDSNLGTRMSGNGSTVVFSSDATDLASGDTNGVVDVFLAATTGGPVTAVTRGNDWSSGAAVSDDGGTVAFSSYASNLVAGDTNGVSDVFVWDRTTGATSRLTAGNGASWGVDLSDDGNRVSFLSDASNLVAGDTNGEADLFVLDRAARVTTRIPAAGGRYWGASISGDGSTVAFASTTDAHVPAGATDTNAAMDIFRWDFASRQVLRITNGDGPSNSDPTLSDDGRVIAFNSKATDIAAGDRDLDANDDLFLWNASTGAASRLTTSGAMSLADTMYPEVSGDGHTVAFSSQADDLDPSVPAAESFGTWNVHVWHRAG